MKQQESAPVVFYGAFIDALEANDSITNAQEISAETPDKKQQERL